MQASVSEDSADGQRQRLALALSRFNLQQDNPKHVQTFFSACGVIAQRHGHPVPPADFYYSHEYFSSSPEQPIEFPPHIQAGIAEAIAQPACTHYRPYGLRAA